MIAENRLELEIISLFDSRLDLHLTIHQISTLLDKRYPYIHRKVTEMIEEEILIKTVVGKSHLCSLNLKNPKTIILLTLNELKKVKKLKVSYEKVLNKLKEEGIIYTLFISDKTLFAVVEDKTKVEGAVPLLPEELLSKKLDDYIVLYGYEKFFEIMSRKQREVMVHA